MKFKSRWRFVACDLYFISHTGGPLNQLLTFSFFAHTCCLLGGKASSRS